MHTLEVLWDLVREWLKSQLNKLWYEPQEFFKRHFSPPSTLPPPKPATDGMNETLASGMEEKLPSQSSVLFLKLTLCVFTVYF